MSFGLMLAALTLDAAVGWPDALYRRVGHPVSWLGRVIAAADAALNRPHWPHGARYALGAFATMVIVGGTYTVFVALVAALPGFAGAVVQAVMAATLLAARSLYEHVAAVAGPLERGDLAAARAAVSRIVGRDPAELDEAGVARASIESLAENASDGVVAPIFWGVILGLPGLAAYKAVNTLDSMIGHRSDRHLAFGGFAARLDDLANLVPARLTGLLIAIAAPRGRVFAAMLRDARRHRSPNAGWPEAAAAGALGIRLSGPRSYDGPPRDEPWINAAARDPNARDIGRALRLYVRAVLLLAAILGAGALT